ncbi:Rap1a/Tai family immunity protein [Massilia horti]|uniref:Rap1a immunity protein domain-containing protein n=1 Tax=Massilia horti TaxID=2562153 RepID=A0A4Y9T378_9BURK|nr:Rap1a/Tai family immunity protein [Massilia horti]TFW31505.1 hypothetical protein E4O92_13675 [Massilia horti]
MAIDAYLKVGSFSQSGGVMRAVIILLGAMLALPTAAQHASVAPWMTGARLVKLLGNVDPATVNWTPDHPIRSRAAAAEYFDMTNGEFVHGYIQAVHDATEGKDWCWSDKYHPKPHELEADARSSLQRMSDAQLKRNAADLIVEVWRAKWPCSTGQRRTG